MKSISFANSFRTFGARKSCFTPLFPQKKAQLKTRNFSQTQHAEETFDLDYKKLLVWSIKKDTIYLKNKENGADLFIIGTAHISKISADEVRLLIQTVEPDTVMVELDIDRAKKILQGASEKSLRADLEGSFSETIVKLFFDYFYSYFRKIALVPGLEFKVAMQEAMKRKIELVYGDRSSKITMKRIADSLSFTAFFSAIKKIQSEIQSLDDIPDLPPMRDLSQHIEKIKNRKEIRKINNLMQTYLPQTYDALVKERDIFMVHSLKNCPGKRIVAVVGMAHLEGLEKNWNNPLHTQYHQDQDKDHQDKDKDHHQDKDH